MSAQNDALPTSPAEIEAYITRRRERLSNTVDALADRTAPKAIARRSVAGVQQRLVSATTTPDGQLRTEKVGAIAAAAVVAVALMVVNRRRRSRRRNG